MGHLYYAMRCQVSSPKQTKQIIPRHVCAGVELEGLRLVTVFGQTSESRREAFQAEATWKLMWQERWKGGGWKGGEVERL